MEIYLDRPESYNAINTQLADELLDAVITASADEKVRAVILTGKGASFCSGGDIETFVAAGDAIPEVLDRLTMILHAIMSHLIRMQKPVIILVNGAAAGGGFSLSMAGDIVLATSKAKFTSAYSRIGATPDGGLSFTLPRIIGVRRSLELYYTDRVLSAEEALDWGLVTRIVPDESAMEEARALAKKLAAGPTLAYGRAKDLLYHTFSHELESQMQRESLGLMASSRTQDFRNATQAFLQKQKPEFQGK